MLKLLAPLALLASMVALAAPTAAKKPDDGPRSVKLVSLGRSAPLGAARTEIAAFDPKSKQAFVTNAEDNRLDVYNLKNPAAPTLVQSIDLSPYGAGPNSVDVSNGLVAVAVEADPITSPGTVEFFTTKGAHLASVPAGALPDMVTFADGGKVVLVANEGEPAAGVDPEGSVTVIDVHKRRVRTARFAGVPVSGDVKITPGNSLPLDLEPEYVAEGDDDEALVTLQEANAVAVLDIEKARFKRIRGLGYKDHSLTRNALDPSDRDGGIFIAPWRNLLGMYQPDAIAAYSVRGDTYYVTANEGDARAAEEVRAKDLTLDPVAFPNGENADAKLGRLNVTRLRGDTDSDGDYDKLYAFGARSMTILNEHGQVAFDTGGELERFIAANHPATFNADEAEPAEVDNRSDNKGPEPEGVDVGEVGGRTYAFLGAERQGGLFAYDLSARAGQAALAGYANGRPADLGPEGVKFIARKDSPNGEPLVLVTNEITGTLAVFAVR